MIRQLAIAFCLGTIAVADHARLHVRDDCSNGYTQCSPQGASATNAPAIDSSISGLYVDLLESINEVQNVKRHNDHHFNMERRDSAGAICCKLERWNRLSDMLKLTPRSGADGTNCLLLQDYELPFCYVSALSG